METVTILWPLCAAIAIVLAAVGGMFWLLERQAATLTLCVLGLAAAASAYLELGLLHSTSAAEYQEWLRWYHVPILVSLIGQVLFVHYYLKMGRVWLMLAVIVSRAIVAALNVSGFSFIKVFSLRSVSLLGEQVSTVATGERSGWQWLAFVSLVLLLAYIFDAAIREWRQGGKDSRRKALTVAVGMAIPLLATAVYTQMLVFGLIDGAVSNTPWLLGVLLVMAYELGRDVVLNRQARLEVAELRAQQAHEQRVGILGQLASALSHELGQPLTACLINLDAAEIQLESGKPDFEELHAILDDVRDDCRRAADILTRMREFFRRRTMEMQPLEVREMIDGAVSLARSEALSRHVALTVFVDPGLPRVVGDRVHLTQVMLNLLMNGIEAEQPRPEGTRRIVVDATANDGKREVEIAVRDFGPGLPDGMTEEVFKPFFTTKTQGMGMGLPLSRTIIEAHGGRLWADADTHDGAVFRFTLKRAS